MSAKSILVCFQRSPTRKPAEGWLSRRASWFCGKSRAVFRGQIFAVHFIISLRKRVSIPKLLQHKNPSQGCTVNLRQPSAKRRVKTKMTFSHGQTFAVHFIVSVRKRVSIPELLQHKSLSQRLRSLRLAPIIGEILPVDFHGL